MSSYICTHMHSDVINGYPNNGKRSVMINKLGTCINKWAASSAAKAKVEILVMCTIDTLASF